MVFFEPCVIGTKYLREELPAKPRVDLRARPFEKILHRRLHRDSREQHREQYRGKNKQQAGVSLDRVIDDISREIRKSQRKQRPRHRQKRHKKNKRPIGTHLPFQPCSSFFRRLFFHLPPSLPPINRFTARFAALFTRKANNRAG